LRHLIRLSDRFYQLSRRFENKLAEPESCVGGVDDSTVQKFLDVNIAPVLVKAVFRDRRKIAALRPQFGTNKGFHLRRKCNLRTEAEIDDLGVALDNMHVEGFVFQLIVIHVGRLISTIVAIPRHEPHIVTIFDP
jgi:hypothetical protein